MSKRDTNTIKGNILEAEAGIIVQGCNAQGVMGSGLAAQIKNKWPSAYHAYLNDYNQRGLVVGDCRVVKVTPNIYVANAITQEFYGRGRGPNPDGSYIDLQAVAECFESITDAWYAKSLEFSDKDFRIHIPRIGAGLGRGDWNKIKEIIENTIPFSVPKTYWEY